MYKRLKKDTKWSILNLGNFKIDNIKKEVSNFSEEWDLFTLRQDTFYTHKSTRMFPICLSNETFWDPKDPVEVVQMYKFKDEAANNEINNIFNTLKEYYSGEIIRCEVVNLPAGTKVRTHIDGGALLHYSRRVHVPIITNKEVTFTVMNNKIHMEESVWYEINNQMTHSADNNSELDRVHLIIDILPNDMLHYDKTGE
jgi:hypothetical protein